MVRSFRKIKFLILLLMVLVFGISFTNTYASADEPEKYYFGITPTTTVIEQMSPGASYNGSFEIVNKGTEPITFTASAKPYSIANEYYTPTFDQNTQYTEIAQWITVSYDVDTIKTSERAKVSFVIDVPEDAHGGTQSAVIIVQVAAAGESQGTGVEMVREISHLIYGNVDGETIESANILENRIPGFLFNGPIYADSIVENTGNIYSRAEYTFQVFPLFSNEEVYTNEEDPDMQVIFPDTKRYNKIAWDNAPQLGIFKVRQTVKIFDQVSTEEKLVFICPIWFLIVCFAAIFILLFSVIGHLRGRNKEN